MRARWQQWVDKFAQLSGRERMLVLLAIFAVAYQLADLVILDRQYLRLERLNSEMAQDNNALLRINTELNALTTSLQNDPNAALRNEIAHARDDVSGLHARLKAITGELISPQDMARFLEELLLQDGDLTMLRLQTLEAQPLLAATADEQAARLQQPVLHRHGFAIEFSGGYMATLRYLQALEGLPWRFFWDSVSYEVVEYPHSVVRLQLHTLSLSEDWIGV